MEQADFGLGSTHGASGSSGVSGDGSAGDELFGVDFFPQHAKLFFGRPGCFAQVVCPEQLEAGVLDDLLAGDALVHRLDHHAFRLGVEAHHAQIGDGLIGARVRRESRFFP